MNVLIVEDEPTHREAAKAFLEEEGWVITTVENGQKALEIVQKNAFDIILLDLRMPVLDGFAFLEQYPRSMRPDGMKIIVMTNLAADPDAERAVRMGADAYLVKSDIDVDQLKVSIEKLL